MNKQIRVLHIIGKVCGGGVEAVAMNYYRHIDRRAVQFDFVIDEDSQPILDAEITELGGRIYKIKSYSSNVFLYMKQIYNIVRNHKYEIVHSHMNTVSGFSLFAALLAGAKVRIIHNHSVTDRSEGMRYFLKLFFRIFSPLPANVYYACSEKAAKWIYGKNKHVIIIHNAIDIKKYSFDEINRSIMRKELAIRDELAIVHIGRFVQAKNHVFLISILKAMVDDGLNVKLFLVGDGDLKKSIIHLIDEKGLNSYVVFLGIREDVNNLLQAMDICILPSHFEGLPVVAIEAAASGLPMIISDHVTREVKITNSIIFESLNNSAYEWATMVLRHSQIKRKTCLNELKVAGYDINIESKKLQKLYYDELVKYCGLKY